MITNARQTFIHDEVNRQMKNNKAVPEIKLVYVTPTMAKKWLESNTRNRRVRERTVQAYTIDMIKGNWQLVSDAIAFDDDNVLVNGQHRLLAVVKSGTTQPFFVAHGLDSQAFFHTDMPVKRALADHVQLLGYKHYNVHSSTARKLAHYAKVGHMTLSLAKNGINGKPGTASYVGQDELLDLATNYTPLVESVNFGVLTRSNKGKLLNATELALIHALYKPWHDDIENFLLRVVEGLGLSKDDPAYALRRRLENNAMANRNDRWGAGISVGYTILAANADFQNRTISRMQWTQGSFPQPLKHIASSICAQLGWAAPLKESK